MASDNSVVCTPIVQVGYWRGLFIDPHTGYPDYKKLALMMCALAQIFTWLRMSLDLNVSDWLENPKLWIVFYAVVGGHDLLDKALMIYAKMKGIDLPADTTGE